MILTSLPTITAAFLASLVEVVEAYTIVLAVGLTRGWRPALIGAAAALALLVAIVALFGPLLTLVPIQALQFVVGVLLILFGMRWLRKAILRSAGWIALHDEMAEFAKETREMEAIASDRRADWIGGIASFKAVLLEGVEVVFIVIATGTAHGLTFEAGLGALAAVVLVGIAGLILHRPLAQVPENTLKFVVGVMLTAFGTFWTGEGLGAEWPGADAVLVGLFGIYLIFALTAVQLFRKGAAS
jgi:uncharacterized membrane protein